MNYNRVLLIGAILITTLLVIFVFKDKILNLNNKNSDSSTPISSSKDLGRLNITYILNSSSEAAVAVAIKNKLFEKYGLEVKIIKASNANTASKNLISGKVDMAITNPSLYLVAAATGSKIKYLGVVDNNNPFVFVSAKSLPEIKTVGSTGKASESYRRSLSFLEASGIETKKINFIDLATSDTLAKAMIAGRVDGASFTEVVWALLKDRNQIPDSFKVFDKPEGDKYVVRPAAIVVSEDALTKKKKLIEDFSKAILEANNWVSLHSTEEVAQAITGVNQISKDDAPYLAQYGKKALIDTKFTPDLKAAEAMRLALLKSSPQLKNYDIKNFISFEISDSLKKQGILSKYGY